MEHPLIRYQGADLDCSVCPVDEPVVVNTPFGICPSRFAVGGCVSAAAIRGDRPAVWLRDLAGYADAVQSDGHLGDQRTVLRRRSKPADGELIHRQAKVACD